ncbi:MAG: hypothetical protein AAGG44_01065 [Planctomycetota bacterium]
MPRVRLTGLFLFITAIFLGLASAATQTSHLRFKRPDFAGGQEVDDGENENAASQPSIPPEVDSASELENGGPAQAPIHFISIPMLYPLTGVGLLGLALWFVPGGLEEAARAGSRSSRGRGSRKSRGTTAKRRAASKGLSMLAARNARRKRR